jgi:putative two-component system response regulator
MAHALNPQIRPTEFMLEKTTILTVDDESGPRESLKMILSPAHKVISCGSAAEAIEILSTTKVDLATIDLNMPGMKGDELMRIVRADYPSTEIIVITGNGSVETAVEGLRSGICDYISKPFDVVEVSSAVSRALARKQSRAHLLEFLESLGGVLGKDRDSNSLLRDLETNPDLRARLDVVLGARAAGKSSEPNAQHAAESSADAEPDATTLDFLDVLAQALESRDGSLRKHAHRVGFYADLLAEKLGVDEDEREHIRVSSFLHDIGKVGLSDEDRERAQLRPRPGTPIEEQHPEIGARLVEPLGFEGRVADAIRHHHECWDGSGHPDSLEGDAIPLAARVIAVVDGFDKLTSAEPACSAREALSQLRKQSGTRFDPALIIAFASMVESGEIELDADLES